ncbi:MAG: PAAR domain-containing protein [Pseudomonadota bacterium]|nr:PAAR domain-containing protein [Pseudomonadota bacterium]
MRLSAFPALTLLLLAPTALANPAGTGCAGTVATGSGSVTVYGKQAARAGDQTGCGQIVEGSSNVFINGKPAAVQGSGTDCGGTVAGGSSGIFINGKPMARVGDAAGCR